MRRFRRHVMPWDARLVMIANGEYRPPETTSLLDAMGLEPGLPDLLLIMRGGRVRWIEVKLARTFAHGRTELSQPQIEMHSELRELDHTTDEVRALAELWAIVEAEGIPHRPWPAIVQQDAFDFDRRRSRARNLHQG